MANETIVRGILQLEVDSKDLEAGLEKVSVEMGKTTKEAKKQSDEIQKLVDHEAKLVAARAKSHNPTDIVAYTKKITETRSEIEKLQQSTRRMGGEQTALSRTTNELGRNMRTAFNVTAINAATNAVRETGRAFAQNGEEIKKSEEKTKSLRAQLREIKALLASEDLDDGEFTRLSIEAGRLQDRINDATDAARIFATDSPFEAVGNAIGSVGSKLLNLDFEGAAKQSQLLVKASQQITFSQALTGIKQLGQTIGNIGKALLTNPLFLIGAVVATVIAKFDDLRESGGLIGTVFNGIAKAIDFVVTGIKDLLDAIGLIDSTRKSLERLIEEQENLIKTTENFFNRSIALRKAAVQSTIQLENQRADAVNKALLKELNDTKTRLLEKAASYEDYYDLQKKLIDIGLRASQVATDKEVRNIEVERDAREKLLKLRQDIVSQQNQLKEKKIELQFDPNSIQKIKAEFALRRKVLEEEAAAEKRQAAIDFVDFDGGAKARALIDKKYSVQKRQLKLEENKALLDAEKQLAVQRLEIGRQTDELLLDISRSNNLLGEEELAEEKVVILAKFYNDKIALLEDNIKKEKALGLSTVEDQKELNALRAQGNADVIKAQDELSKTRLRLNQQELEETKRHEDALIDAQRSSRLGFTEIEGQRQLADLQRQEAFEQEKLDLLIASGEATAQEVQAQENAVTEIRAQAAKQRQENDLEFLNLALDGTQQVLSAEIAAANTLLQVQADKFEQLTSLQEQRVDDAKKIAEDGNAELLEAEQKRLDDLNKQRERFVRAQQSLAAIELVANASVAVAKAAAQGGVAAPFTIAATIIALIAGLAQARAVASQAAFYEGGLYDGEGYTGDGNPRDVAGGVGRKPYTYHKQEFIFNHQTTSKYRDTFQDIHEGRIDLNELRAKARAFDRYKRFDAEKQAAILAPIITDGGDISQIKGQMEMLINAVKSQGMSIKMDSEGWEMHLKGIRQKQDFVRNKLAKA